MITLPPTSSRRMPVRRADVVRALGRDRRRLDPVAGLAHRRCGLGTTALDVARRLAERQIEVGAARARARITSGSSTRSACSSSSWPVWSPSRTTIAGRSGIVRHDIRPRPVAAVAVRADSLGDVASEHCSWCGEAVDRRRRLPGASSRSVSVAPSSAGSSTSCRGSSRARTGRPAAGSTPRGRARRRSSRDLRAVRRAAGRPAGRARAPPRRAPHRRQLLRPTTCSSGRRPAGATPEPGADSTRAAACGAGPTAIAGRADDRGRRRTPRSNREAR